MLDWHNDARLDVGTTTAWMAEPSLVSLVLVTSSAISRSSSAAPSSGHFFSNFLTRFARASSNALTVSVRPVAISALDPAALADF